MVSIEYRSVKKEYWLPETQDYNRYNQVKEDLNFRRYQDLIRVLCLQYPLFTDLSATPDEQQFFLSHLRDYVGFQLCTFAGEIVPSLHVSLEKFNPQNPGTWHPARPLDPQDWAYPDRQRAYHYLAEEYADKIILPGLPTNLNSIQRFNRYVRSGIVDIPTIVQNKTYEEFRDKVLPKYKDRIQNRSTDSQLIVG